MIPFRLLIAVLLCLAFPVAGWATDSKSNRQEPADGWISHPSVGDRDRPVVLHFRRLVTLDRTVRSLSVWVTADNRFILYVNGARVAAGPSTGDTAHWRQSSVDIGPFLRRGRNVISAVVWNAVKLPTLVPPDATPARRQALAGADFVAQTAPYLQQSIATGFRLMGAGVATSWSTDQPGWLVMRDQGRTMTNGLSQRMPGWYIAGAPETIDAAKATWDAAAPVASGGDWVTAAPAPDAVRNLITDRLPAQHYRPVASGKVVRSDLAGSSGFPQSAVVVPANGHFKLLIQREAMVSGYPVLNVAGGEGARIKVTYAEALYDAQGRKGDRNLVADRVAKGPYDTFLADGAARAFAPLWWRTWRYVELDITTASQPLTLKGWRVFETGYPFSHVGRFASSDPELHRIWTIGWRTAQVDAHETYMDSSHWEQLQYVGDTRLQMLISYAVSGDPRLAEQAIDAFAHSTAEGGLTEGAYPSRSSNVIATFSLLWIGMLDDWRRHQPDPAPVRRNLLRMRQVLDWFEPWLSRRGLLTKNPQWNFVDWVGQSPMDRSVFPSYSKVEGESCLTSVHYLGALRQGAAIEAEFGDPQIGKRFAAKADVVAAALREHCWDAARMLFADNPDRGAYSQQMNALAVLYDVVPAHQAQDVLSRIVFPGKGIDAPDSMRQSSYYFAWYLIRAFEHAGLGDRYLELLKTWRDLLPLNYTTWPEERGNTRSDTHAWSAHPTADLLGVVAGVAPGAPGYRRVRIRPHLGPLVWVKATAATPAGPVHVHYRMAGDVLRAIVNCPKGLPGTFEWGGRVFNLRAGRNMFVIQRSLPGRHMAEAASQIN